MRSGGWASAIVCLVAGSLACRPATRGRCDAQSDCRTGTSCVVSPGDHGVCVVESGVCNQACGAGEICVAGSCVTRLPSVEVEPQPVVSAQLAQVKVIVTIAQTLKARSLTVSVAAGATVYASGTLQNPGSGENVVSLAGFPAGQTAQAGIVAVLGFDDGVSSREVSSPVASVLVDTAGPAASVFVVTTGSVNGWFPRDGGNVEVRAQVDDGAGSGAASAVLQLATCPATSPCSYAGTALDATTFDFVVPRVVQQPGSEAPVPFTVTAFDKAGNASQVSSSLPIDDAGPKFGATTPISTGVTGEDGKTWFPGGGGAKDVSVSIPVGDASGIDPASVTAALEPTDVKSSPPPALAPSLQPDGTVHVALPASEVRAREGSLRFSLTAKDKLGHATTTTLGQELIWVDDLGPQVSLPKVSYGSAQPAGVCDPAVQCGRTATQLLRDDTATVTFDVWDCGSGLPVAPGTATITSGGKATTTSTHDDSQSGAPCAGSPNRVHHFSFTFDGAAHAPLLGPVGASGVAFALMSASVQDLSGNGGTSPAAAAGGDGSVALSPLRWKAKLPGATAGAPALLPGAAPRNVVVGTGSAVAAFSASGAQVFNAAVPAGVGADVAVGADGSSYVVSPASASCSGSSNCGTLSIVSSAGAVRACAQTVGAGFGAGPVVLDKAVIVAATARDSTMLLAPNNLFVYDPATCTLTSSGATTGTGELKGAAASPSTLVVSNGGGVTGMPLASGTTPNYNSAANFSPATAAVAAPSIADGPSFAAWFSGPASGGKLYRAVPGTCALISCYQSDAVGFPPPSVDAIGTPVFDAGAVYVTDRSGTVWAWSLSGGALRGSVPPTATQSVSAPVLLQGGSALVVEKGGAVRVVTPSSGAASTVMPLASFSVAGVPQPPVVESRGSGLAVAYVVDDGSLWAVQLTGTPLAAATAGVASAPASTWPRPGRDSCNSRSSGSTCN